MTPTEIRTDAVARLLGQTSAGARVLDTPMTPWQDVQLWPVIGVFVTRSSGRMPAAGGPSYERDDDLVIEATTEGATDAALAAELDTLEGEILGTLLNDAEWVRQFSDVPTIAVARGRDAESRKRRGTVQVTLTLNEKNVTHASPTPSGANSFERVEVTTELSPDDSGADTDHTQTITLTGDP